MTDFIFAVSVHSSYGRPHKNYNIQKLMAVANESEIPQN